MSDWQKIEDRMRWELNRQPAQPKKELSLPAPRQTMLSLETLNAKMDTLSSQYTTFIGAVAIDHAEILGRLDSNHQAIANLTAICGELAKATNAVLEFREDQQRMNKLQLEGQGVICEQVRLFRVSVEAHFKDVMTTLHRIRDRMDVIARQPRPKSAKRARR